VKAYGGGDRRCTRFDERECWDRLRDSVPYGAIHKSLPGWVVLCRKHVGEVLKLNDGIGKDGCCSDSKGNSSHGSGNGFWRMFEKVWAPEEVFFPTALALLGYLPANQNDGNEDDDGGEVINRSLMHAKWDHRAVDERDRAHPLVYDDLFSDELVNRIRNEEGCVFMRKLKKPLDLGLWEKIVLKKIVTLTDRTKGTEHQDNRYFEQTRRRGVRENGGGSYQDDSHARYYDNNDRDRYQSERDHDRQSGSQTSKTGRRNMHRYEPYRRDRR